MAVSKELRFPDSDEQFEEMCFHLYKEEWKDPTIMRIGGGGQRQYGLDLIGRSHGLEVGVQCKYFVKTSLTLATVCDDLEKLDQSDVRVDLVIFATTAPNKSALVMDVRKLSDARRSEGKCAVTINFWSEISALLRTHPRVGQTYIPDFPGSTLLQVQETSEVLLLAVQAEGERDEPMRNQVADLHAALLSPNILGALAGLVNEGKSKETNPFIATQLDLAREKLLLGRPADALELLKALGDPAQFKDVAAQARWHATRGAALLISNRSEDAATEYFLSASIAPDLEKSWRNKAHAHLLTRDTSTALEVLAEALRKFPESPQLWALQAAAERSAGAADPGAGIPTHLLSTSDVLFTMSGVRYHQGRLEEAYELIQRCLHADKPTGEVRRVMLATALSWALSNPAAAQLGQIEPQKLKALREALVGFEPLESTIPSLQSDDVALEVASNAAVSLHLLDEIERARAVANAALVRHPYAEALLRIRIDELGTTKNVPGIRSLAVVGRLREMPDVALASLAEIATNLHLHDVFDAVVAELRSRSLSVSEQQDLTVMEVHAAWTAGRHEEASQMAKAHVAAHPAHVLGRVELTRILSRSGDDVAAALQAHAARELVEPKEAPSREVILVADLLRELGVYDRAVPLYARVVANPSGDVLTYRYLFCLIESDHRSQAQQLLEQLPESVRTETGFRRLEANLARRAGDWSRTAELYRLELENYPRNASIAAGYVGALHRLSPVPAELLGYLASNPQFECSLPDAEAEFAKYETAHGLRMQAIRRVYRLLRANPNDTSVAGYYLAQVLVGEVPQELAVEQKPGPGTLVALVGPSNEVVLVGIDPDEVAPQSWPALVGAGTDLARTLTGKEVGDRVELNRGLGLLEYEIKEVTSIYAFAVRQAQELLHAATNNEGPVWSMDLPLKGDMASYLVMVRAKAARSDAAFREYGRLKFPLSTLAKAIGTSTVELVLGWPREKAPMFVSLGTEEERQAHADVLQAQNRRVVLDLATLCELVALEVFRNIAPLLGRPLVPGAVRDEMASLIDAETRLEPQMSLVEEEGQLARREFSEEFRQARLSLLKEMLACIDELCEVTPVLGPSVLPEGYRTLEMLLDDATMDAVALSLERDAILLVDDAALRLSAATVGITATSNVQSLLMFAYFRGAIQHGQYVNSLHSKLIRNQDFVSMRSDDLLLMCQRNPYEVDPGVLLGLNVLRGPQIDVLSGVKVVAEMLQGLVGKAAPVVVAQYFRLGLEALTDARPTLASSIKTALAVAVRARLSSLPRARKLEFARLLGSLLRPATDWRAREVQQTAVAAAVQELTAQMRAEAVQGLAGDGAPVVGN